MRLEARNVSFRYGGRSPWVLSDCSLSLESGERLALTAPSGYSKATLALLLAKRVCNRIYDLSKQAYVEPENISLKSHFQNKP